MLLMLGYPQAQAQGDCATPSDIISGGCFIRISVLFDVHYRLIGEPAEKIEIAVSAPTEGYVGISWKTSRDPFMIPADAVIGWLEDDCSGGACANVSAYDLRGYDNNEVVELPEIELEDVSVETVRGRTTMRFTRRLDSGNHPITLDSETSIGLAYSSRKGITQHDNEQMVSLAFASGTSEVQQAVDRTKFWIIHGALMLAAWLYFAPTAILLARYKSGVQRLTSSATFWFHVHRLAATVALGAHVAGIVIAKTEFVEGFQDSLFSAHEIMGWTVTALLGAHLLVAIAVRPAKDHKHRAKWNIVHFTMGRLLVPLALATCAIGIKLYDRKEGGVVGWVAAAVAIFALLAVQLVALYWNSSAGATKSASQVDMLGKGTPVADSDTSGSHA